MPSAWLVVGGWLEKDALLLATLFELMKILKLLIYDLPDGYSES
jgi:hypothetical protein